MSKERSDSAMQPDNSQCFSDFFLSSLEDVGVGRNNYQNTLQSPNMPVDNSSRNQFTQQALAPFSSYPEHVARYPPCDPLLEDDVFSNPQQSYTQVQHQPYVTYQPCHTEQQYQQTDHPAQRNIHIAEQTNYDAYIHSASPDSGDRASISNSPYTPTVRQDFSVSPPSNPPLQNTKANSIPSMSDYAGDNNFEIYFGNHTESAVKSAQYTYSSMLGKLFVKMNVLCPIQFRCAHQPPAGCYIRALPVYTRPEHVTEVVTRCPNHRIADNSNNDHLARHLMRGEQPGNDSVQYLTAPDGRESVTITYVAPEVGSEYITVFYTYTCLSSCVGGINRRPIMTIFTLEAPDGKILARRCVEVRICCCPGRDRAQEEKRRRKPGLVVLPKKKKMSSLPSTSTAEPESGDGQEFFLRIKGKEKYEILRKIKEALDLKELVTKEQKEEYEHRSATEEESAMKQILSNYFKKGDGDGPGPFPT